MEYLFLKNGTEEEKERKIYNPPTSHSEVTADSLQIDIVCVPHVI
jgi:hypothetical protein